MADTNTIFLNMKEEIERTASIQEAEILDEIRKIKEDAYTSIKEEAKKEADMRMNQEIKDLKSENASHISDASRKMNGMLREKREQYENEIFSLVEEKLLEYAGGDDYINYLLKKRDMIINELGECVLYINSNDLKYSELLKSEKVIGIKIDETISIGGIKGSNDHLILDETLDYRLEIQKEWFYSHSGFVIG